MTHFADLQPCHYLGACSDVLVAVGWLSAEHDFARDSSEFGFVEKLKELLVRPWSPVLQPGLHKCQLCQFNGPASTGLLFVPYEGRIFLAPKGIVHYIECHWYKPPDTFIAAVNECPPMQSMEYKKCLLSNGGRVLVRKFGLGA